MAWVTPKTNWVPANGVADADMNRIEGNTLELYNTKAPLASPALTGVPTVPTAAVDTNTTQAASTAFVVAQAGASTPLMDGAAAVGTSKRYARDDHRHASDTTKANLASPTFTGVVNTGSLHASGQNKQITAGDWTNLSGNTDGYALFSNNVYSYGASIYKYTNTHGNLGGRGIRIGATTGPQWFDTGLVATTADATFTPTFYKMYHAGSSDIFKLDGGVAVAVPNSNWNDITVSGYYMTAGGTNQPPLPISGQSWFYGEVIVHNSLWQVQNLYNFDGGEWRRYKQNNVWGAWKNMGGDASYDLAMGLLGDGKYKGDLIQLVTDKNLSVGALFHQLIGASFDAYKTYTIAQVCADANATGLVFANQTAMDAICRSAVFLNALIKTTNLTGFFAGGQSSRRGDILFCLANTTYFTKTANVNVGNGINSVTDGLNTNTFYIPISHTDDGDTDFWCSDGFSSNNVHSISPHGGTVTVSSGVSARGVRVSGSGGSYGWYTFDKYTAV